MLLLVMEAQGDQLGQTRLIGMLGAAASMAAST